MFVLHHIKTGADFLVLQKYLLICPPPVTPILSMLPHSWASPPVGFLHGLLHKPSRTTLDANAGTSRQVYSGVDHDLVLRANPN
jgi:hypothetical protein